MKNSAKSSLICILLTIFTVSAAASAAPTGVNPTKQVFGYYTDWDTYGRGYQPADMPVDDLTVALYAFAKPVCHDAGCQLVSADPYSDFKRNYGKGNMAKVINRMHALHKNALLSIGGYTLSAPLTQAIQAENQTGFIDSTIALLKSIKAENQLDGFDGVDIDWEPNDNQWTFLDDPTMAHQTLANYLSFMTALRAKLKSDYTTYAWTTIALPADPAIVEKADRIYPGFWQDLAAQVDYMDVMTYDYHGAYDSPKLTNFLAPLTADPNQPTSAVGRNRFNITATMQTYVNAGVPANKLIVGIPAYGRAMSQVAATIPAGYTNAPGLYQTFNEAYQGQWDNSGIYDYREIVNHLLNVGFSSYRVASVAQTVAYNPSAKAWMSFDGVEDVKQKSRYIKNQGFAGAMVWSLSGDVRPSESAYHSKSLVANLAAALH